MNSDGTAGNDSRLFLAKQALTTTIAAYPEIDFALARYHQDQSVDRSCQLAHWFECASICCTYDDPTNNTPPAPTPACTVNGGSLGTINVNKNSPGDECINYAGNCGPPRRGADVVAGFGKDINQYLMWLDHDETNFDNDQTEGDFCSFASGGDCELRGTGPTPLAGSLQSIEDHRLRRRRGRRLPHLWRDIADRRGRELRRRSGQRGEQSADQPGRRDLRRRLLRARIRGDRAERDRQRGLDQRDAQRVPGR
jgi:hypothetical protein